MLARYDTPACTLSAADKLNADALDRLLLERAKQNLDAMFFFAINEHRHLSQLLFERTLAHASTYALDFKFNKTLEPTTQSFAEIFLNETINKPSDGKRRIVDKIKELNSLDMQLYEYALAVFFERLKFFRLI